MRDVRCLPLPLPTFLLPVLAISPAGAPQHLLDLPGRYGCAPQYSVLMVCVIKQRRCCMQVTFLMGPSGAGKSTLFNCLSGKAQAGTYDGCVLCPSRFCMMGTSFVFCPRLFLCCSPTALRHASVAFVLCPNGFCGIPQPLWCSTRLVELCSAYTRVRAHTHTRKHAHTYASIHTHARTQTALKSTAALHVTMMRDTHLADHSCTAGNGIVCHLVHGVVEGQRGVLWGHWFACSNGPAHRPGGRAANGGAQSYDGVKQQLHVQRIIW